MHDAEQNQRQISSIVHSSSSTTRQRRSQRQRISPSPEPQFITALHSLSPLDPPIISGKSHQSSTMTHQQFESPTLVDPPDPSSNDVSEPDVHSLDPSERRKHTALAKVQGKLDKAQRLYQSAHQSVEQNISEFLRVTTLPGILSEANSSAKTTNAAFDKRIRTLQETKKELEKKISHYQADLLRIQAGDIPHQYSSSKDILNNIKNKVASGTSKHRSSNDVSGASIQEPIPAMSVTAPHFDSDNPSTKPTGHSANFLSQSTNSNTLDITRSSPSNSVCNEIGNSQFYVNSNYEHIFETDKSVRRHDNLLPDDLTPMHEFEKSPSSKRRLTDDSTNEFNDHISEHSSDDRYVSFNPSKRNTMVTHEHNQLMTKIEAMQKTIDRSEQKSNDMQKQIEILILNHDLQREQNERLTNELTDLTDLHQLEMSVIKTDLRKLEDRLLYNFKEYWGEMVEKLDKLDTRTTKVEQTQTHSLETEENTHRIITKLVNILLTVFAIILLLLSTIKNLVQSRVHAVVLLILVFVWITFHSLPESFYQRPLISNFTRLFKSS